VTLDGTNRDEQLGPDFGVAQVLTDRSKHLCLSG